MLKWGKNCWCFSPGRKENLQEPQQAAVLGFLSSHSPVLTTSQDVTFCLSPVSTGQNTVDKEYFLPFCPLWWPQSYPNSLYNNAESPTRVTLAASSSFNFPSHARTLISIYRERIFLNITVAGIMCIFIAHLSSWNFKSLQVLITVLICFYHGCCSSWSSGPRFLSLIFGQYRSGHKLVQTRREVCLSKVGNPLLFCPALAHQICCNCVFNPHLAFFWFKLQSLWGSTHMAPSGKGFNPSTYNSQETHMKSRGNDLSNTHVHQGSITVTKSIRPLAILIWLWWQTRLAILRLLKAHSPVMVAAKSWIIYHLMSECLNLCTIIADDVSPGICPERLKATVDPLSLVAFFQLLKQQVMQKHRSEKGNL